MSIWKNVVPNRRALHELKREALLREAVAAFNQKGFHATSLEDIASSLGVTKAALYHYFPNKNALLWASFERAMGIAFESLEKARERGGTSLEILSRTLKGYLAAIIDDLNCCVILTEENALLPKDREALIPKRDRFEHGLRDLVETGIADGSIIPCNSKLVVFALLGAINWVPKWFSPEGPWRNDQLAVALVDMLCRGLSAQPVDELARDISKIDPAAL